MFLCAARTWLHCRSQRFALQLTRAAHCETLAHPQPSHRPQLHSPELLRCHAPSGASGLAEAASDPHLGKKKALKKAVWLQI